VTEVDRLLRGLHAGEVRLAATLRAVAERHRAEHEVFHVARDIAGWSDEHASRIAAVAAGRGAPVAGPPGPEARDGDGSGSGGPPLLDDLRRVHRDATAVSVEWELLGQAARTQQDPDLLVLTGDCRPRTLRQVRWALAQLRTSAPQLLVS
jgi:hypothetical protein